MTAPSEIDGYETLGDIDAPFVISKAAERRQRAAEDTKRAVSLRPDAPAALTHEQLQAGEPCPGCGMPLIDNERWESRGTLNMTPAERSRYDAEQERFAQQHGDCRAVRWSIGGSLTLHCSRCCPPTPMSPEKFREIARLFAKKPPLHELMRWRVRLYCGHEVERMAHRTYTSYGRGGSIGSACPACGLNPSVPVDAVPLGLAGPRPAPTRRPLHPPKPGTKACLQAELDASRRRVAELEAEVARLQD